MRRAAAPAAERTMASRVDAMAKAVTTRASESGSSHLPLRVGCESNPGSRAAPPTPTATTDGPPLPAPPGSGHGWPSPMCFGQSPCFALLLDSCVSPSRASRLHSCASLLAQPWALRARLIKRPPAISTREWLCTHAGSRLCTLSRTQCATVSWTWMRRAPPPVAPLSSLTG